MNNSRNNMLALAIIAGIVVFAAALFIRTDYGQKLTGINLGGLSSDASSKYKSSKGKVPDQYIVVLKASENEVDPITEELVTKAQGQLRHTYKKALKGFAAKIPEAQVQKLMEDPRVEFIEEDSVTEPTQVQTGATWGLDRIDQQAMPLDTTYNYELTGQGVNAYIIDTGIRPTHVDFGGRARVAYDALNDGQNGIDCSGHGTHVAGTVGSTTYGVAKQVNIFGVRVLPCSGGGYLSDLISGIDWVTQNRIKPAVANVSITASGISSSLDRAINQSINSGVVYAIAAGNSNLDACNYSPGSVRAALTVGASGSTDIRGGFSNYGSCVDIFAPGVVITSLSHATDVDVRVMSGTSMASPHVAGVAALYLQAHPTASASEVASSIVSAGTKNVLTGLGAGDPNNLLYSFVAYAPPTDPPPPPTSGCSGSSYAGSVTAGGVAYHPSSGFSGRAGLYNGVMTISNSGSALLSLERKQGKNWSTVATSSDSGATQNVSYNGSKGSYRWKVAGTTASTYTICSKVP